VAVGSNHALRAGLTIAFVVEQSCGAGDRHDRGADAIAGLKAPPRWKRSSALTTVGA
jgi:hypothetical protein